MAWSSSDSASRIEPLPPRAISATESASCAIDSASSTRETWPAICSSVKRLQVELQAAREHRHRQLLRVGGGEQELGVLRRFLQRLQQRVEGVSRQHVHFVDQVHLVLATGRAVLRVLDHLAHVVDAGVARRIDLQQVEEPAGIDIDADRAHAAWLGADAALAVEALGEDPRDGGLADPARSGEQEGVVDPPAVERMGQCADHVLLADELGEALGPPFAGEDLIGHWAIPAGRTIVPTDGGRGYRGAAQRRGGGPRRPAPGTRISDYRCSLPGLAGFATYRRGEPTGTTIERPQYRALAGARNPEQRADREPSGVMLGILAERAGFEPAIRF